MKIRSEKTKKDFIKYLEKHPGERFWQAVRNFSGYSFIIASDIFPDNPNQADTFHWEGKIRPNTGKEKE